MDSLPILFCRAKGRPSPSVQWYKDDTAVNPFLSPMQQSFIVPHNMPHTTVYTCKAMNNVGNTECEKSANITVIVK